MAEKNNRTLLIFFIVLMISLYIGSNWDKIPFLKDNVTNLLDPTLGALLKWNSWIGFIIIIAGTSLILTLSQKYLSDQAALKELKKEQKILNDEMKKYKEHPEKLMELQKKQLEFLPKTFNLTMKPLMYTSIPIILLFRWFSIALNATSIGKWWILYYILGSIIFSSIFRKVFDVA